MSNTIVFSQFIVIEFKLVTILYFFFTRRFGFQALVGQIKKGFYFILSFSGENEMKLKGIRISSSHIFKTNNTIIYYLTVLSKRF